MSKVFISYSHEDDKPFGPRDMRWVETFERALQETLGQRVGPGRVKLWRDKRRMDGATLFDKVIIEALDDAELLITVLSRPYLDSSYCQKELHWFGRQRLARGGLHVKDTSRILKVYRAAIDREALRRFAEVGAIIDEIDGSTGYHVYCSDDSGGVRDVLLDPRGIELVWQKADDLARTITRVVDSAALPQAQATIDAAAVRTIYLAHVASDMREARDALRRELEDRGHVVLPSTPAREACADCERDACTDIAGADLSVHLLGERYGPILEGGDASGVAIQAVAALNAQHSGFGTLFWSLRDGPALEPRLEALVDDLSARALPASRAEFVRSSFDELKAQLLARLAQPRPQPPSQPVAPAAGPALPAQPDGAARQLYLLCDPLDREATKPLKQALEQEGFEVVRPPLEGSPDELLAEHKLCLVSCDVVAIVWGQPRETWVRSKLRDLQQAPGWGRTKAFAARIVIVGPPDTPAKQDFDAPPGVQVLQASEVPAALSGRLQ